MDEFLKSEFTKLKENNVISSEVYTNILNYYNTQDIYNFNNVLPPKEDKTLVVNKAVEEPIVKTTEIKETPKPVSIPPKKTVKEKKPVNITLILSIISAVLISGGIISIIGYNWNAIPRLAKSIAAFFICISSPVTYAILTKIRNKEFEQKSKEFFSIMWILLFGGSIAFVSQIYRMPSNPVSFFIAWIIISIGVLYAMKSYFAFFISLILEIIYCVYSQQFAYTSAAFFYPSMFLLFFFTKENKKLFYIWLIELIVLISVVFEKCLPGLWIIAYVSLDIILLNYGEKEDDKVCRILGYIQAITLGILLAIPYFWKNIGFIYYRENVLYNKYGAILDYIITIVLYAGSIWFTIKNGKYKLIKLLSLAIILSSYLCCCFINSFDIYITRVFLATYLSLFIYYIFKVRNKYIFLYFIPISYVSLLGCINFPVILILSILVIFNYLLNLADNKKNIAKAPSFTAYILILALEIYYLCNSNYFNFTQSLKECKFLDLIIFTLALVTTISYSVISELKSRKITKQNILSKVNFYILILSIYITNMVGEYTNYNLKELFIIFFAVMGTLNAIDFVLNKRLDNYVGIILFIVNYFVYNSDSLTDTFIFAFLFLMLFAFYFYADEKINSIENINYCYLITYLLIIIVEYFIFNIDKLDYAEFNPFSSITGTVLFITLLAILFVIPLISALKNKKLLNLSSIILATISVVFLIFSKCNWANPKNFIYIICLSNVLSCSIDILRNKKIENVIILSASVVFYFVELTANQNNLNGITLAAIIIFAIYTYSKNIFNQTTNNVEIFAVIAYVIYFISALVLDNNSELFNQSSLRLFDKTENIISTIIIFPVLIGVPIFSIIKNKELPCFTVIGITFTAIIYYCCNSYINLINENNFIFVISFMSAISSFLDVFLFKKKMFIFVFAVSLFKEIGFIFNKANEITIFALLFIITFAILIYSKYLMKDNKFLSKLTSFIFSILFISSMELNSPYYSRNSYMSFIYIYSFSLLIITLFILPFVLMTIKKFKINFALIPLGFLIILSSVLYSYSSSIDFNIYNKIFEILIFILLISFCISGIFNAYLKSSLKNANYYLIVLCIGFIIRFFMISKGLVERGFACILCGIALLIMNLIFSKKTKTVNAEEGVKNED